MIPMLATETFGALGSQATVAAGDPASLGAVRAAVEAVVEQFDSTCSRFREDSELSAVNRQTGRPVAVSPLFLECADAALRGARLTDGDVDPTVGRALIALGYDRDFDQLARHPRRPVSIAAVAGWRTIRVEPEEGTVCVPAGVQLDFGATAKALAADRAAARAFERAGCGVLVSLGGDIAIAGPAPEDGWPVRVTDDHRADASAPGQWITLRSGGLATSSTTTRRWGSADGPHHHLIDPGSGRCVRSIWRTASVAARSCLDANIASTAAIVRGVTAVPWLESLGLPSRLVSDGAQVCHLAGWSRLGDDLPALALGDEVPVVGGGVQ